MRDRGVSTVVSYVLTLGIVVLLLSSLVGVFAPLVSNQQDDAVRSTLDVFGNDIAGDIESADRLASDVGDEGTVELRVRLPDRVGGSPYEITLEPEGESHELTLWSPDYETRVRVTVTTEAGIETDSETLDGGSLVISYDTDRNVLVIESA